MTTDTKAIREARARMGHDAVALLSVHNAALPMCDEIDALREENARLREAVDIHRPEENPILAAILVVRHAAAANFTDPQHKGQRGRDYDAGLLAAFHAARAALEGKAN